VPCIPRRSASQQRYEDWQRSSQHRWALLSMLTDIPASDEWYCKVFGMEFGPLPGETVRRMVQTEQLTADDLVRASSGGGWRAVRDETGLRMLLKGGASRPGPTRALHSHVLEQSCVEWYYKFEGRAHGPLTLADLVDLIGASGDTAHDVIVRRGPEGSWMPAESLPGMPRPRTAIIHRGEIRPASTISTSPAAAARMPARTAREFIRDNRDPVIAVAVWLVINVVILVAWTEPYTTERRYFATLRSLEAEVKALRDRDASGQDWTALRARGQRRLIPMVADLEKTANASEPIRQHILWAARDLIPKLMRPDAPDKDVARLYRNHMKIVERELSTP
jgi:hypothetical protein